jgi:transcriptional regulator with XRE-family HTH domain
MEKSTFTHEYRILRTMLREARLAAKLTQEQLAERLGETQSFVSKCERGERRLDLVQMKAFCHALGTTLSAFVATFEKHAGGRKSRIG